MALNSKLILSQFWSLEIHNWYHWVETKMLAGSVFLQRLWSGWEIHSLPLLVSGDCMHSMTCSLITPNLCLSSPSPSLILVSYLLTSLRRMLKIVPRGHLDIQRCLPPMLGYFTPPAKSSIKTVCKFQGLGHRLI